MSKAIEISTILKNQIKNFGQKVNTAEIGNVITVGDGIALVSGLNNCVLGELLKFDRNTFGMALSLEENFVGVVLMSNSFNIKEGDVVKRTGEVISVPVGDGMVGRVVNALGNPKDSQGEIVNTKKREIFRVAPGVMTRESVNEPLETGILSIDSMIPIGKGQRELIIGDRQTGKTAIAIDAIINQKGKNVKCIYVAIGQKNSTVAQIAKKLEKYKALEYTTIVAATASEMAPLQYIAPYSAITMAEEWMEDGKDVLIVYDDLSKHAVAYRSLSLLLRRPPGREAYPGDVFYLHSQLLERAAKVNKANGGGSITAIPIVETQAGDISAYIPTNVISITDGQIFTMSDLFNSGQRPAVDPGYSVSRVGSSAQFPAMKKVSSSLKLELAQYNEMAAFAQFGSDFDESTKKIISHGKKVLEIMKQNQYELLSQEEQVIILMSVKKRLINPVPFNYIKEFKKDLITHFKSDTELKKIVAKITETKKISLDIERKLITEIKKFTLNYIKTISKYSSEENYQMPTFDFEKEKKEDK